MGRVVCVNSYVVDDGLEYRSEGREYTVVNERTRVDSVVRIVRIVDVRPVYEALTVVCVLCFVIQRGAVCNREYYRITVHIYYYDVLRNSGLIGSESSGKDLRFLDVRDRTGCVGVTVVPLYKVETGFRGSSDLNGTVAGYILTFVLLEQKRLQRIRGLRKALRLTFS